MNEDTGRNPFRRTGLLEVCQAKRPVQTRQLVRPGHTGGPRIPYTMARVDQHRTCPVVTSSSPFRVIGPLRNDGKRNGIDTDNCLKIYYLTSTILNGTGNFAVCLITNL
jgi:hypothetical protein